MSGWTIYHNPNCGTSRNTLALLREHGVEPEVIQYLKTPPGADGLKDLLRKLGISAKELLRKKEKLYKEMDLAEQTDSAALAAMVKHPVLMERPVVVRGGKAVLGRLPENVLQLL